MSITRSQKHLPAWRADALPADALTTSWHPLLGPLREPREAYIMVILILQMRHLTLGRVRELACDTQLQVEEQRFELGPPNPHPQVQPRHPSASHRSSGDSAAVAQGVRGTGCH